MQTTPAFEASPSRLLPRRLGRYQLFAHIGRGGMADIHLAHADTGFGDAKRLVVIKEMRSTYADSAAFSDALVDEAKLAAQLSHANVVKVEDLGRVDGSLFIAMEYVEGLDLRQLLRACAKDRIALPVDFSMRVVTEILRGLSFAHRARDEGGRPLGIVHRDVSPSNVLLSFDGEVKVCDFGIARANAVGDDVVERAVVGKAGYMSPEQARGDRLDGRSDVFAAGIILWELLAGRRLYRAPDGGPPLLALAQAAVIPPLPDHRMPVQPWLYAIVKRALSADPEDRYPSAAAMLDELEEYASTTGQLASQLRLGEWLMENFGRDVVRERRSRERAMRALARGPAAVIQPVASSSPTGAVESAPDQVAYELTPSQFMVAPTRALVEALAKNDATLRALLAESRGETVIESPPVEEAPRAIARPDVRRPSRWEEARDAAPGILFAAACGILAALAILRALG